MDNIRVPRHLGTSVDYIMDHIRVLHHGPTSGITSWTNIRGFQTQWNVLACLHDFVI
ncbi:hypothetical protein DPMN_109455 [Dreissena polymorpha]|uniref:Uncharacterized protein n=1 Tax=Dreissena polymorpha TaxID=45954 RepID=A0A9D4QLZ4_DREPO|nr:hypothetical protein DPMN_109455 [Dreissena polymorpha]